MLYLGLVAGVAAGNLAAHAARVDAFRVYIATLILIGPALLGARLLYVAAHWPEYRNDRGRIWNRNEGGLAMYGGLPVMLGLSVPVLWLLNLEFGAFWDVAIFTVLMGMAFTKTGCFMNGCCAGRRSESWIAIGLRNRRGVREKRIPVQCLEAAWAAILAAIAIAVRGQMAFRGALFLLIAAGYAFGRLVLEFLREREPGAGRFSLGQAVSVVILAGSIAVLLLRWPR